MSIPTHIAARLAGVLMLAAGCAEGLGDGIVDSGNNGALHDGAVHGNGVDSGGAPGLDVTAVGLDGADESDAADDGADGMDILLPGADVLATEDGGFIDDVGITGVDAGPQCSVEFTCSTCAGIAGCGWCSTTETCEVGTLVGPSGGACASWAATATACLPAVDPCASATDCGTCGGQPGCGWCGASAQCMTGSYSAPTRGTCSGSWMGIPGICNALPSDSCGDDGDCLSCTFNSSCGWCEDTDTCHHGNSSAPTDQACNHGNWTYHTLDCL